MRTIAALSLFVAVATAQDRLLQAGDLPARATAAAVLEFGLASADGDRLRASLATARECLPPGSFARALADQVAARETIAAVAAGAAALCADLRFEPVVEAPLPAGVPGWAALDEIVMRDYPAYRMARTSLRGGAMAAFRPLFEHIRDREIAMTTPVQVDFRGGAGQERAHTMAFLYGAPALGEVGAAGTVDVVDVAATTVLSVGSRGYDRPQRIAELRERLQAWLARHPEWEAAGELRTMGYNSPSVPDERRCFEVQLPVRRRAASGPQGPV